MDTQLSFLDLPDASDAVSGDAQQVPNDDGARLAAARAVLAAAAEAAATGKRSGTPWMSVRLDDATCELGRRRVTKARAVVAEARQRAEAEARTAQATRQRAALAGAITADLPVTTMPRDETPPTRRPRRARPAA